MKMNKKLYLSPSLKIKSVSGAMLMQTSKVPVDPGKEGSQEEAEAPSFSVWDVE